MKWNRKIIRSSKNIPPKEGMLVTPLIAVDGNASVKNVRGRIISIDGNMLTIFYDKPINGHDARYNLLLRYGINRREISNDRSWNCHIAEWDNGNFEYEEE